jgi:hypothetical protein
MAFAFFVVFSFQATLKDLGQFLVSCNEYGTLYLWEIHNRFIEHDVPC